MRITFDCRSVLEPSMLGITSFQESMRSSLPHCYQLYHIEILGGCSDPLYSRAFRSDRKCLDGFTITPPRSQAVLLSGMPPAQTHLDLLMLPIPPEARAVAELVEVKKAKYITRPECTISFPVAVETCVWSGCPGTFHGHCQIHPKCKVGGETLP